MLLYIYYQVIYYDLFIMELSYQQEIEDLINDIENIVNNIIAMLSIRYNLNIIFE